MSTKVVAYEFDGLPRLPSQVSLGTMRKLASVQELTQGPYLTWDGLFNLIESARSIAYGLSSVLSRMNAVG